MPGTLEISGTVDEESGGYGGVHYLAQRGWFSPPRVDHVIIPEPLNVDRVCIGHRGVWWGEIETYGPDRARVDAVPRPIGDPPHGGRASPAFEPSLSPALERAPDRDAGRAARRAPRRRSTSIPCTAEQPDVEAGAEAAAASPLVSRTGSSSTTRLLIEEDLDEVKASLRAMPRSAGAEVEHVFASPTPLRDLFEVPSVDDRAGPAGRDARPSSGRTARARAARPPIICSPGTYDQKRVTRRPLRDCIAYGPGILDLAHQPDEYV